MKAWIGTPSLRIRLSFITLVSLLIVLLTAHVGLSGLFREHVVAQFDARLVQQLDQITARLDMNDQGQAQISGSLSDPRWDKPYSGLYWQLDEISTETQSRFGVLRSRSLWDTQLQLSNDALADGEWHAHDEIGPLGTTVRVVERAVQLNGTSKARWRLMVAADTAEVQSATDRFNGVLGLSLLGLGFLLLLTAWAQVVLGLSPLNKLHAALQALRQGQSQRLEGQFPNELHALISDFNTVLDRNTEVVTRARTQAGNLAHALKTPLAVLRNAATQAPDHEWRPVVQAQVDAAQRQIDWHLARARASAAHQLPGQRTEVAPILEGLLRVMRRVHLERRLDIEVSTLPSTLCFAGEEQDLQEMLGNLIDNACRNATAHVRVSVQAKSNQWLFNVDDDGPGVPPSQYAAVLQRGVRLDESQPGSGLGLAIVVELAELYGGNLTLHTSPMQGLQASLTLPTAT